MYNISVVSATVAILTIRIATGCCTVSGVHFALSLSAELVFMLIRNTECELIFVFYAVVRVPCSCICDAAR